ncbi:cytidylyltransferase-like domain-containing protein [Sarocladium implicatum]|nr:cytidylyltransferase-like domain-containing protein [Sarocladium implicatum]
MASNTKNPHLLLLPPPPPQATRSALNTLYRPTLSAVLTRLADSEHPSVVVAALACPILKGHVASSSRQIRWKYAQSLLAGIYVIVASVCAERGIATDVGATEAGSVDVRIVLVDHEVGRVYEKDPYVMDAATRGNGTTVLDLMSFTAVEQQWATVFHPSCENGYALLTEFLKLSEGKKKFLQKDLVAVDCGTAMSTTQEEGDQDAADDGYSSVCLGGTFDHLHPGHKLLLHATALLLNCKEDSKGELIVGISGDALLVKKQYAEELQPWTSRAKSVISFLSTVLDLSNTVSVTSSGSSSEGPKDNEEIRASMRNGRVLVRCVNIPDPFGPTITEEGIQAIVVSGETRSGGKAINDKREAKNWNPLVVYEIDVLDAGGVEDGDGKPAAEGFESKISSTMIRKQRAMAKETSSA